jgi:hypothetical protein
MNNWDCNFSRHFILPAISVALKLGTKSYLNREDISYINLKRGHCMKTTFFWDAMQCSAVGHSSFEGNYCLHLQGEDMLGKLSLVFTFSALLA